jgi:hypothetical protein
MSSTATLQRHRATCLETGSQKFYEHNGMQKFEGQGPELGLLKRRLRLLLCVWLPQLQPLTLALGQARLPACRPRCGLHNRFEEFCILNLLLSLLLLGKARLKAEQFLRSGC